MSSIYMIIYIYMICHTGFFKKTTTRTYTVLWSCSRPPAPQLNVGHSGCTRRPSKKTTILVTGASHYNLLQHWVGGAGGAAINFLMSMWLFFLKNPVFLHVQRHFANHVFTVFGPWSLLSDRFFHHKTSPEQWKKPWSFRLCRNSTQFCGDYDKTYKPWN